MHCIESKRSCIFSSPEESVQAKKIVIHVQKHVYLWQIHFDIWQN